MIMQPSGVERALDPLPKIDEREKKLLEACFEGLKGNVAKGIEFVENPPPK